MRTMRNLFVACLILLLTTTNLVLAQDQTQALSLSNQLTDIINRSESYEHYKVIKTTDLTKFRSSMLDSVNAYQGRIQNLETDLAALRADFTTLKEQFDQTQLQLEESEAQNASIPFLWTTMDKSVYNIIVWSLVALLAVAIGILYFRIKHVCAVVKRVKSAYSKIMDEYRTQRHQSVEKQMKLKRELQTVQNRLEMLQSLEETV